SKCLERDANRRLASAAEVAAELRRFLAGEPIKSRPISGLNRTVRWARRKPAVATAGMLTCVLAIAGPLAALLINNARMENARLAQERLDIIDLSIKKNDQIDKDLAATQQQLDDIVLANPGIEDRSHWQKKFIADFVDHNQAARQLLLDQPAAEIAAAQLAQAQQHLGWQYLLHAAGETEGALQHGMAAQELLITLQDSQPKRRMFRALLAECWTHLSQIQDALDQSAKADQLAQQALEVRTKLAQDYPNDLRLQMEQLESTSLSLKLRGAPVEEGLLTNQAKLWASGHASVRENMSVDSRELYQLACYLTQHENLLRSDFASVTTSELLEQDEVE
ncbi:MAG: hypothetical protein ACR2NM_15345, partial [Bythopirellula sp.]